MKSKNKIELGRPGSGLGYVKIWSCVISNTKSLLLSLLWISCHLETFWHPGDVYWNLEQIYNNRRGHQEEKGRYLCPMERCLVDRQVSLRLRLKQSRCWRMNIRQTWEEWGQNWDKDKSNFLVVLARNNLFLRRIEKNYLPTLSFISRQGGSNFQVECKKPRIIFQFKRSQNWPYLSQETE